MKKNCLFPVFGVFVFALLLVSCGGNTSREVSDKGVLKKLPVIAHEYSSKLQKLQKEYDENEGMGTEMMQTGKSRGDVMGLLAELEELEKEMTASREEGEKEMEAYIETTEFEVPATVESDGLFELKEIRIEGAVINPPDQTNINIKADVVFNKDVTIGYRGDMKKMEIYGEFLDKNGETIKTEKFYRGVQFIGRDIESGSSETLHCNPRADDLGKLDKIMLRVGNAG
jgi:hypothetical protein